MWEMSDRLGTVLKVVSLENVGDFIEGCKTEMESVQGGWTGKVLERDNN